MTVMRSVDDSEAKTVNIAGETIRVRFGDVQYHQVSNPTTEVKTMVEVKVM